MATWTSLSPSQQASVETLANGLRAFMSEQAKLADMGVNLAALWNGGVASIVNSLGSTEVIPNTSGLAGAQDLAPADITNAVGYAINQSDPNSSQGGVGGYNTSFIRTLAVKMAGPVNC